MTEPAADLDSGDPAATSAPSPGDEEGVIEFQNPLGQLVTALVALVLAGLWCVGALQINVRVEQLGMGPKAWPLMIGIIGLVLSIAMLCQCVLKVCVRVDKEPSTRTGVARVLLTIGLVAVAIIAWRVGVNYLIWMPVMMIALLWVYGARGWKGLLGVPAIILAIVYFLFDLLLKVPL